MTKDSSPLQPSAPKPALAEPKLSDESTIGRFVDSITVREKYEHEWGAFRRFIASRPLTGFWCGVAAGFGLRIVLGWLL
jgi:hypothetical protein